MIDITVNGNSRQMDESATVDDLIVAMDLKGKRIAVEVNGEIVPASQHAEHVLNDADKVEIVGAIGGG